MMAIETYELNIQKIGRYLLSLILKIITFRRLDYRMRKETINAVKNINFDVKKGEILGLVGD